MPNNSSATTKGKLVRNSTCLVYAADTLTAKALDMKCSIRNNPTGTMPVSECRRRSRKECPSPARSGATPCLILGLTTAGAAEPALDPTTPPYDFRIDKRTFYYRVA